MKYDNYVNYVLPPSNGADVDGPISDTGVGVDVI